MVTVRSTEYSVMNGDLQCDVGSGSEMSEASGLRLFEAKFMSRSHEVYATVITDRPGIERSG